MVYYPYKSSSFTTGLLVVGVLTLLLSMYISPKYNINQHDPSLKSIRQPSFGQRHPYITVFIVWAVGVALSVLIKWAFMHPAG